MVAMAMVPRVADSVARLRSFLRLHLLLIFLCSTLCMVSIQTRHTLGTSDVSGSKRLALLPRAAKKGFGADTPKAKKAIPTNCPCLSGKLYRDCCRPCHKDPRLNVTPEQLARARYSALALKKYDYLIDTTHPSHPDYQDNREAWKKVMTRNNRGFRYVGLNVTSSEPRGQDLHAVTFEAASEPEKVADLPQVLLTRECSIYRFDGAWKYAEAEELKREVVKGASSVRQFSS
mmetsp:Transcript_18143/g.37951  ORF Transcript_18143/g.37951 Transcript_18143/m.37951 type:complete len:232 (-) Transcript_18143:168-863(-)